MNAFLSIEGKDKGISHLNWSWPSNWKWVMFNWYQEVVYLSWCMYGLSWKMRKKCWPSDSDIQGAPKKMYHSNLYPISVPDDGFYFFTYVLESEFWARFIWTFKQCLFWILIALKTKKHMRGFSFQPTKVKLELCRLCIISPNPI